MQPAGHVVTKNVGSGLAYLKVLLIQR